ncbi:unknown [Acidaminococcus sp. CAG:542]|nr:unknown [Acidaminococcus sp. CAG:542]
MPRTPWLVRPMDRTSSSWKWMAYPSRVASRMSLWPLVSFTSISSSPSPRLMAIRPPFRADLNSLTLVRFTKPRLVAMNRNFFSSSLMPLFTAITALTFSFSSRGNRFRIKVPLAVRLASGISNPFCRYTRPRLVKNRMLSWVLAMSRCSEKSPFTLLSSFTILPLPALMPRPPRFWFRKLVRAWRLM